MWVLGRIGSGRGGDLISLDFSFQNQYLWNILRRFIIQLRSAEMRDSWGEGGGGKEGGAGQWLCYNCPLRWQSFRKAGMGDIMGPD